MYAQFVWLIHKIQIFILYLSNSFYSSLHLFFLSQSIYKFLMLGLLNRTNLQ